MDFKEERREVARFMRRAYNLKLTTTSGGNFSRRVGDGLIAVTPSQLDKGRMRGRQVALMDLRGNNLTPDLKISSEGRMHLRIYQEHAHIGAIVHAHPVTASAFCCAETPIRHDLLAEQYCLMQAPLVVPYAMTSSDALAEQVAACAGKAPCLIMENHGVTTTGATLLQAFDRLELLEIAARLTLMMPRLEGVRALTDEQKRELDALMGR